MEDLALGREVLKQSESYESDLSRQYRLRMEMHTHEIGILKGFVTELKEIFADVQRGTCTDTEHSLASALELSANFGILSVELHQKHGQDIAQINARVKLIVATVDYILGGPIVEHMLIEICVGRV